MSISFQAKAAPVLGRQLEAQEVNAVCDLVAATSDAPSIVSIDNSTIASTVITLDIQESIEKAFSVQVIDRTSGQSVALAAAPSLAVDKKISVTVDGTGLSSVCVCAKYKIAE